MIFLLGYHCAREWVSTVEHLIGLIYSSAFLSHLKLNSAKSIVKIYESNIKKIVFYRISMTTLSVVVYLKDRGKELVDFFFG